MTTSQHTQHVTTDDFDQRVIGSRDPVLVDFYADWCAPCRMIAPVVEQLAGEYAGRATVVKVNVDDSPELAARFSVSSIPTLMVFRGGESVERFTGVVPADSLRQTLDEAITTAV